MSNKTASGNGIGFGSLLALTFIILKLCNVITWSWLWVLAPIWIPLGLGILIVLAFVTFVALKGK